jgi:hypothetical protein
MFRYSFRGGGCFQQQVILKIDKGLKSVLGFTFVHWVRLQALTKVKYDFLRSEQLVEVSSSNNERSSAPHVARNLQRINFMKNI